MGIEIGLIAVGSFVTAGFATGVAATVIGGAIVGAAIGGLTSALMGGDIGKGMLFGAIGGAVTGGVVSMAGAGSSVVSGVSSKVAKSGSYGVLASQAGGTGMATAVGWTPAALGSGAVANTGAIAAASSASVLESVGAQVGIGALSSGVKSYLARGATEDAKESESEAWDKRLEAQKMQGEQAMEQLRYTRESASAAERMAMDARLSELDQRKNEFTQTMELNRKQFEFQEKAKADRQALFAGASQRGGSGTDTYNDQGIYDTLQQKPQGALVNPEEELV